MCCPAALEWGLCKASTWFTVLSKSTVCPVPSLLFSPFPSNRIDRCEAFALLIMWKKMIDQSTVSKSDLGLGLNSLHMVAASLPAGGRPVLAWNRRLPQWNRNSLRGTACYLRLSCCFLLLRVYRINYSYIIICNYSIYIYIHGFDFDFATGSGLFWSWDGCTCGFKGLLPFGRVRPSPSQTSSENGRVNFHCMGWFHKVELMSFAGTTMP